MRNWRAFANLKVSGIAAPMSFHHQVSLDFPVSIGGYRHTRDPDQPICLHLVHVPGAPNQGLDARAQFRIGQGKLLAMTFADFEARIRDDLDRMLGPGGFSSARDIAAITVNRWPHGYSYVANTLFDPEDYDETVLKLARRKAGRVAIANTDAGGDAWVHFAIDQAARAVGELEADAADALYRTWPSNGRKGFDFCDHEVEQRPYARHVAQVRVNQQIDARHRLRDRTEYANQIVLHVSDLDRQGADADAGFYGEQHADDVIAACRDRPRSGPPSAAILRCSGSPDIHRRR